MSDPTYPRPTFRIIEGTRNTPVAIELESLDWFEVMDLLRVARDASAVFAHYSSKGVGEYFTQRVEVASRLLDDINEGLSR
jgi:hypothetical protein